MTIRISPLPGLPHWWQEQRKGGGKTLTASSYTPNPPLPLLVSLVVLCWWHDSVVMVAGETVKRDGLAMRGRVCSVRGVGHVLP